MKAKNKLVEANIVDNMENKLLLNWQRPRQFIQLGSASVWRACVGLLCDTTDERISYIHGLIPKNMYCILFNAKQQMNLAGSARLFVKSLHRCASCY